MFMHVIDQYNDPPLFIHDFLLSSKEILCHFRSLLANLGHFQFTSNIIAATLLVEIVMIQHDHRIVCSSYCWLQWDASVISWHSPLGLRCANDIPNFQHS